LNRLFSECGIASHDDEGEGGAISHTVSLREFIPAAAERFHAAATQHGGPRYELSALRAALQMTRHISLVFGGAMTRASSLEQLEAGRQLLHVLEQDCLAEVVGVQIGIGDGYGSDASGALWLWSEGDAPSWAKFLQGTDLEWHRTQRAKAAALRSREQAAAKALGVGMVLGHPAAVSTPQYERLMNDIADAGPAGSGQAMLQKVVLRLEPGSGGGGASGCRTDGLGKICLPVDLPLPDILACVKQLGPTAAREADALAKEEADIATLRRQVERALKLRLLSRDPDLPTHKFRAACLRLLQHSAALMPLLDGLPLRVTEVNSFVPGRSAIDIAWNFTP